MTYKDSITISVPSNITTEEIKNIRKEFKESELSKEHRLNIIVSGCADPVANLGSFLAAYAKK